MNDSILKENESKRLTIRLPLLSCFVLFAVWQLGVIYFSGTVLSVSGRTPLPISPDSLTILIIAGGYISSIVFMLVFPKRVILGERIMAITALISAILLFSPLPTELLVYIYVLHSFCCVFMVGLETSLVISLFAEKTVLLYIFVAYAFANAVIAILQNDIINIPFSMFRVLCFIIPLLILLFFFKLPARTWPKYVDDKNKPIYPKQFFAGLFTLGGLGTLMTFFGVAVAESTRHGVFAFYISAAISGIILYLLWKKFRILPIRSGSALLAISAIGFVLAIVSLYVPALALLSCMLLGTSMVICNLQMYYGFLMMKRYPSKMIAPSIIGISFTTLILHSLLLEALRDNMTALYVVYLVIAVSLVILYLILEPYLIYSFCGKPLISDERAAELNEAARAAVGDPSVADKTSEPEPVSQAECEETKELTDRERQVAQELMSGYDYKEIAKRLYISPHTVAAHRKKIYGKLEVHNVPELIAKMEKLTKTQDEVGGQ